MDQFGGKQQHKSTKTQKRAVVCLTDMLPYESATKAAEAYGVSKSAVSHVCNGVREHVKGLKFAWADSPEAQSGEYFGRDLSEENAHKRSIAPRKIVCLTDGKPYGSVSSAAKAYDVNKSLISRVCGGKRKHARGLKFAWADSQEAQSGEYFGRDLRTTIRGYVYGEPRRTICMTDGKVYESVRKAAEAYGVSKSAVSHVCTGRRRHAKGLVFRFFDGFESRVFDEAEMVEVEAEAAT